MLALTLTADLTGVTDLRPDDSANNPYYFTFRVQCTSCRETHPNWESHEQSGSRGEANFVWRCKNCKREHSASIKNPPQAYQQSSPSREQKIVEFDCRGLEFVEFKAEGQWLAKGTETGTQFSGIELLDGEWYDYDEKAGEEVNIKDVKWQIIRA